MRQSLLLAGLFLCFAFPAEARLVFQEEKPSVCQLIRDNYRDYVKEMLTDKSTAKESLLRVDMQHTQLPLQLAYLQLFRMMPETFSSPPPASTTGMLPAPIELQLIMTERVARRVKNHPLRSWRMMALLLSDIKYDCLNRFGLNRRR